MIRDLAPDFVSSPSSPVIKLPTQADLPETTAVQLWERNFQAVAKRMIDVVLSIAGLIMLAPALCSVAALISATSRGPVLFWQKRIGRNGSAFWCAKFRTHYEHCCDISGVGQTVSGDPRVTPVGRFLRRHSIDELPQLWNVLRGEMSLVGPRAHVADMMVCGFRYDQAVERYDDRHRVRPGITGLAQIRGFRGPVLCLDHARSRIESDLEYIERSSLSLDLAIIFQTVILEVSFGSGV